MLILVRDGKRIFRLCICFECYLLNKQILYIKEEHINCQSLIFLFKANTFYQLRTILLFSLELQSSMLNLFYSKQSLYHRSIMISSLNNKSDTSQIIPIFTLVVNNFLINRFLKSLNHTV